LIIYKKKQDTLPAKMRCTSSFPNSSLREIHIDLEIIPLNGQKMEEQEEEG